MKKINQILIITAVLLLTKVSFASGGDTLFVSPNPFDSVTVIEFSITNNDTIWLDVLNINGSKIKTYYSANVLPSGTYTLNFNGDTLPNGIYFVQLKINSTITHTVKLIKNTNAVGIKQVYVPEYNFVIHPNPTNSVLNIIDKNNLFQNSTIEIRNLLEQIVFTCSFNTQINLSNLTTGVYFLTVQDKSNYKTTKIVKE